MSFKFELDSKVAIEITGEVGTVKGRADYVTSNPSYFLYYKSAYGSFKSEWISEESLIEVV